MRVWVASILGGLALAPVVGLLALLCAYALMAWRGVTEQEGRRGMTAFLYAAILGVPLGFWMGFKVAWWLCTSGRGVGLGMLVSSFGVFAAGVPAFVVGVHLAEARGVSFADGARTRWAIGRVAVPAAVVGGAAAFGLGWWLCRSN